MNWEEYLWLPSILTILLTTWWFLLRKTQIPPSPSAAVAVAGEEYEVFLSFHGQDIRHGFTDFLYTYLCSAGISTFRDNEGLDVGEQIGPDLLKAINDSKILIPIFSKNYAFSKWCLLELRQMVECHANGDKMIFPIFYDVDPSEVRDPNRGSYEKAFRQHKRNFDKKTVQQWEEALGIVGNLTTGLELKKETNWHQGELVKIVVEKVLSKLKKNYKHLREILVGIDHHVDKLKESLNIESNGVRFVEILGMGGLGKTTIAKVIYNQLCESFQYHCFLEDVRENSNSNGIVNLQNQLLSKILKRQIPTYDDDNEGVDKIRGAIRGKKVFIVLDDVDKISQIEKLAGNFNYGAGSRIIITTRNAEVLVAFKVSCEREGSSHVYKSYNPDLMDDDHSLKLFSNYAFMRDSPPKEYESLAKDVVSIAGGLPLVLVTLGSLLSVENDKVSWQERFKKLKAKPPKEVRECLRISYDALDDDQQQIFLDIACFFAGVDKTNPCYMWDDCNFFPLEGINALVRRSLITVREEDNTLRMHDQLRELGRQIVYDENKDEPGKRSRLWCPEEALDTLTTHQLTRTVKALSLDLRQDLELDSDISSQCLEGAANLRFLRLGCADLEGDFKHLLSSLRWLQWSCQINFKPINFLLNNLVILDLSGSQITDEWKGWSEIKMATKLKVLNLSHCYGLRRVTLFSTFASLERLILSYCTSLEEIERLGGSPINLRVLDLSNCRCLRNLDCSMFPALESLDLQWCEQLRSLDGLEQSVSFKNLNLSFCRSLVKVSDLPSSKKIEKLYFRKIDDNINYWM